MVNFMTAQGKKILVITKQVIETSLSLKDVDVVHYGSARGFNNNSKNYDLVIVYGAWHLPPYERLKLIELGIMEGSIIELENAEIVQAVNRFRPILRPQIPIIMMTQSIAEYQEETWTTVPDKSLEYYSLYPVVCADDIVMRDTDFSVSCYVGYKSVVDWLQRWVFNILNRNQRIVQCRYEHKTIAQTASRCGCSTSTVKRVYKKVIELYGDKLHRYERKLFELDI